MIYGYVISAANLSGGYQMTDLTVEEREKISDFTVGHKDTKWCRTPAKQELHKGKPFRWANNQLTNLNE
jgi:hypothetical protein